ncbi:MAG: hypothetical protein ACOH5I_16645 [Oligoflexus sp.]
MKRLFAGQTEVESIRKVQNCEIPYDLRELNNEPDSAQTMTIRVMSDGRVRCSVRN